MKFIPCAALLLLTLLAIDGLVGAANAATARSAAAAVTCAQTVAVKVDIKIAPSVVADQATDTDDCRSGHCRGSSCHCACHGVVGALPASFIAALPLMMATNYPPPFSVVASRHPSPPIRPPRA